MGLGPPVCLKCKRVYHLDTEAKMWSCPTCLRRDYSGEDATSLFLIPRHMWPEYERDQ